MTSLLSEPAEWRVAVIALDQGCIMAGLSPTECSDDVQAHHVITQQQLRHLGMADHVWDVENGAALCETHHRRHHNRHEPIPWSILPARCRRFANDLGIAYLLGRYYT